MLDAFQPAAIVLDRITDARLREAYLDPGRRGWTPLMQAIVDGDTAGADRRRPHSNLARITR